MGAKVGGSDPVECPYYIYFDMEMIEELKRSHQRAIEHTLELLPPVKWSSRKEIIKYFAEHLGIELKSTRITEIEAYMSRYDHDSEEFYIVYGVCAYLRLRYTITNYLDCVIRHQKDGVVRLRYFNGGVTMPNRQPLTHSEEIKQCIMHSNYKENEHGSNR